MVFPSCAWGLAYAGVAVTGHALWAEVGGVTVFVACRGVHRIAKTCVLLGTQAPVQCVLLLDVAVCASLSEIAQSLWLSCSYGKYG